MKYLKTFEELSPEVYKNAANLRISRNIEEIEEYERITGRKAAEAEAKGEEKAKEQAKELEDFAEEREKHWDEEKQMYDFSNKSSNLPPKKD